MSEQLVKHIKRDILRRNEVGAKYWIFHWERYTDLQYIQRMVADMHVTKERLRDPIISTVIEYVEMFGVDINEIIEAVCQAFTEIRKEKIDEYTVFYVLKNQRATYGQIIERVLKDDKYFKENIDLGANRK